MKNKEKIIKLPKYIEDMHEDPMKLSVFKRDGKWRVCYSSHEAFLYVDADTKEEACNMALEKIKSWEWNKIGDEEVEVRIK